MNRHAKSLGASKEEFTSLSLSILTATTPEAYAARKYLQSFLTNEAPTVNLDDWMEWWHSRREFIFRAFTSKTAPNSNLAEVVHPGWKHRDRMGVSLLDACLFDIRDSLLLEFMLQQMQNGAS